MYSPSESPPAQTRSFRSGLIGRVVDWGAVVVGMLVGGAAGGGAAVDGLAGG